MPRKTIHSSVRQFERWQRAADSVGVSLSELITAAIETRVDHIERDREAKLERRLRAEFEDANDGGGARDNVPSPSRRPAPG